MSNYYTHFSFIMSLPSQEAVDYALNLHHFMAEWNSEGEKPKTKIKIPKAFHHEDAAEDWSFECEDQGLELWFHSENDGIDPVCDFVQHLLEKFAPNQSVEFEWSNTCDKPSLDTFGGGAAWITAAEVRWFNTSEWIAQQNNPDTNPTIALIDLMKCLNNWMDIADEEDRRDYDTAAMKQGILTLAKLTRQTPEDVCKNENLSPDCLK